MKMIFLIYVIHSPICIMFDLSNYWKIGLHWFYNCTNWHLGLELLEDLCINHGRSHDQCFKPWFVSFETVSLATFQCSLSPRVELAIVSLKPLSALILSRHGLFVLVVRMSHTLSRNFNTDVWGQLKNK